MRFLRKLLKNVAGLDASLLAAAACQSADPTAAGLLVSLAGDAVTMHPPTFVANRLSFAA